MVRLPGAAPSSTEPKRAGRTTAALIALAAAGITATVALVLTEVLQDSVKHFLLTAAGWMSLDGTFGALDFAFRLALVVAGSMVVYAVMLLRGKDRYLPIPALFGLVAGLGVVFSLFWAYLQYNTACIGQDVGIAPCGELTTVFWLALSVLGLSALVDLVSFWLCESAG